MKRRKIAAALLCIVLPLTQAGKCEQGGGVDSGSGRPGFEDPKPHGGVPTGVHNQPNPGAPEGLQQPAPPPADPGPYQDPKSAVFVLIWQDERAGSIEYTVNGPVGAQKIPAPQPTKGRDGKFHGNWTKTVSVINGQVIGFTWFPTNKNSWSMCTLYHEGKIVDYQIAPSGGCAVGFTVS